MNAIASPFPRPAVASLRWIARLIDAAADRLDAAVREQSRYTGDEQFDSDAYLAEVRNRVFTRHYY